MHRVSQHSYTRLKLRLQLLESCGSTCAKSATTKGARSCPVISMNEDVHS